MAKFLFVVVLLLLAVIVYQDFVSRAVSVWCFLLLAICFVYHHISSSSLEQFALNVMVNVGFCVVQFLVLTIYFSIKNSQLVNITDNMLGLGDMVMLLVLCFVFTPLLFLVFFSTSMIMAVVTGLYFHRKKQTIPLAGIQSVVLMVWIIIVNFIFSRSLYDDTWIFNALQ
jgi:hypothetical protein